MKCPRCLNENRAYFYLGSKGYYCRRCVGFSRVFLDEEFDELDWDFSNDECEEYTLAFPLTKFQKEVAVKCARFIDQKNVLIHAVCGSGKTEIVVLAIAQALGQKKRVCFAIPRRQVVLELQQRLQGIFIHAKVVAVCGGHTDDVYGDLIVCTTHQLFRYYQTFDLLILDEPDAFPFRGNPTLHGIALTSCKGHIIYLTATLDAYLTKEVEQKRLVKLSLDKRPHGHPLPVPRVKVSGRLVRFGCLCRWLKQHKEHPRMVFVPTIKKVGILSKVLSIFTPVYACTSKTENKDAIIAKYRKDPNGIIVTTTILERGVTIPNVDICVYEADHQVFDLASLIQMAGRSGRTFAYPEGDVLFLSSKKCQTVKDCVQELERVNAS